MWTKSELSAADAGRARGIRADVSPPMDWMRAEVETPLADAGLLPHKGFANQFAMNVYDEGCEVGRV